MYISLYRFQKLLDHFESKKRQGAALFATSNPNLDDYRAMQFVFKQDGFVVFVNPGNLVVTPDGSTLQNLDTYIEAMHMIKRQNFDIADFVKVSKGGETQIDLGLLHSHNTLKGMIKAMARSQGRKQSPEMAEVYNEMIEDFMLKLSANATGLHVARKLWRECMPKNRPIPLFLKENLRKKPLVTFSMAARSQWQRLKR